MELARKRSQKLGVKLYKVYSKRMYRLKRRIGKLHHKIKSIRKYFNHCISRILVKNYDVIVVENLSIKKMMKNNLLSKHIQDAAWYQLRMFIKYKAQELGKQVLVVPKNFPSSKMCSNCGNINTKLTLSDRLWICPKCKTKLDRDINAAKNLELIGKFFVEQNTLINSSKEFQLLFQK